MQKEDLFTKGQPLKIYLNEHKLDEEVAKIREDLSVKWKEKGKQIATFSAKDFTLKEPCVRPPVFTATKETWANERFKAGVARLTEAGKISPANSNLKGHCKSNSENVLHFWIEVENALKVLSSVGCSGISKVRPTDKDAVAFVSATRMKHLVTCWMKRSRERFFAVSRRNNIIFIVEKMCEPFEFQRGDFFEQMCTDSPDDGNDFYAVNRSEVGGHVLFVCGEVDAVDENNNLIEIKMPDPTKWKLLAKQQNWFQSHIMGIDEIRHGVTEIPTDWDSIVDTKSVKVADLEEQGHPAKHFCALKLVLDVLKEKVIEGSMLFMHLPENCAVVELFQVRLAKMNSMKCATPPPKGSFGFHLLHRSSCTSAKMRRKTQKKQKTRNK
jgi:hypothetical protein